MVPSYGRVRLPQPIFTPYDEIMRTDDCGSEWNRLALTGGRQDPFCCTTAWNLSFHEAFSPKRRLLVRSSDGNVVSFAEKVFGPDNIYLTPIECMWLFGANLLGARSVDLLHDTLIDIEKFYHPVFPKIVLSGLAPRGALIGSLQKRFGEDLSLHRYSSGIQCAASLAGGLDGFLSRRSGNHRRKLRKSGKQAFEQGVTFERQVPGSDTEVDHVYARMLAVELASWKGEGRCGMTEPEPKQFYHLMLRRLARTRSGRVIFARHEDKDIGFIFGGLAGKLYRGQQFSYDQDWSASSIGSLLQFEQIGWLCEEGVQRYDMGPLLGDRMEYKSHWAEERFRIETWMLARR